MEIYRRKEDKDNFIEKAFKVCKVFKVKSLKAPKLDVPSKKTVYNPFCKGIRKTKKELQGAPALRRRKSTTAFTKNRNDDMKKPC